MCVDKVIERFGYCGHPIGVHTTPSSNAAAQFHPTLLGTLLEFEHDESTGMITDENQSEIYVESELFTGWMSKALFWDLTFED